MNDNKDIEQLKNINKKERNKSLNEPPKLPVLVEIGNSITHGVGAVFGLVALILMLGKSDTPLKIVAACFYGVSIFLMMLMSSLYHAFKYGLTVKRIWRRFDYSSIYLLIGGTFAPLFLVFIGGTVGIVLFIVQWSFIIFGITMVSVFGPGRIKWLHFLLYFTIGWAGIVFVPYMIQNNINLLWWILCGGVVYTVGMVPFAIKKIKISHFIWHFFVLTGAVVQWVGIYLYVF